MPMVTTCAARIRQEHDANGNIRISIDLIIPQGCDEFANRIVKGFNEMMEKVSGYPHVHEENYYGVEADIQATESLEDYYNRTVINSDSIKFQN